MPVLLQHRCADQRVSTSRFGELPDIYTFEYTFECRTGRVSCIERRRFSQLGRSACNRAAKIERISCVAQIPHHLRQLGDIRCYPAAAFIAREATWLCRAALRLPAK